MSKRTASRRPPVSQKFVSLVTILLAMVLIAILQSTNPRSHPKIHDDLTTDIAVTTSTERDNLLRTPSTRPINRTSLELANMQKMSQSNHATSRVQMDSKHNENISDRSRTCVLTEGNPQHPHMKNIILVGDTGGGLGNQIENILEHLAIIRTHCLHSYVLPMLRARQKGDLIQGDSVWDINVLRTFVQNVYTVLPPECDPNLGGKVDIRYIIEKQIKTPLPPEKLLDYHTLAEDTIVVRRERSGLDNPMDLRDEINKLLSVRSSDQRRKWATRAAVCVQVGIHAATANWNLTRFLRHGLRYITAAKKWPLDTLAVAHLRWDEKECIDPPNRPDSTRYVCVKLQRPQQTHIWVPLVQYADVIAAILNEHRIKDLYIARSPYVPAVTWSDLVNDLGNRSNLRLQRRASEDYSGEDINYVEREIAIRSRLFIGESASTWSLTVARTRSSDALTYLSNDVFGE